MRSAKYLDQLKQEKNLKNDVALCKELGWSSARMSQYRSGKNIMDNEACIALALALNIDPMKIIMECDIDRAEKTGQKSLWENFLMRAAQNASAVLCLAVFVNLFLTPLPAKAATMRVSEGEQYTCYKLCENIKTYFLRPQVKQQQAK